MRELIPQITKRELCPEDSIRLVENFEKIPCPLACKLVFDRCLQNLTSQIREFAKAGTLLSVASIASQIEQVCLPPQEYGNFLSTMTADYQISQIMFRANLAKFLGVSSEKLDTFVPAVQLKDNSFSTGCRQTHCELKGLVVLSVRRELDSSAAVSSSLDYQRTIALLGGKIETDILLFAARFSMSKLKDKDFTVEQLRKEKVFKEMDPEKLRSTLNKLTHARILVSNTGGKHERWTVDNFRLEYVLSVTND